MLRRWRARHAGTQQRDCVRGPDPGLPGDDGQLLQLRHRRIVHGRRVLQRVYLRRRLHVDRRYRCLWQRDRVPRHAGAGHQELQPVPTGSDFVLQVSFLLPLGIGSGTDEFVATIFGTQGQPGDLDFDDTFTKYTFTNLSGTGSFEFRVNDILSLSKNHSATLTGDIRSAVFTPTGVVDTSADPCRSPSPLAYCSSAPAWSSPRDGSAGAHRSSQGVVWAQHEADP